MLEHLARNHEIVTPPFLRGDLLADVSADEPFAGMALAQHFQARGIDVESGYVSNRDQP